MRVGWGVWPTEGENRLLLLGNTSAFFFFLQEWSPDSSQTLLHYLPKNTSWKGQPNVDKETEMQTEPLPPSVYPHSKPGGQRRGEQDWVWRSEEAPEFFSPSSELGSLGIF